ncbi:uncharacterized protein CHSO_0650 [Chryseobacterium sp. StRB126]|uniref:hypothetical protein n=1 Tax=Chryseobacterium sp. StRB126 TaxID=878220 RepID=UPI0004E99375|nr:hypothetical protein [Chryseobacterium sp. StRB126]BAP29687.1 uncharacterized protein CHSO_0650 [Chryseobacterium sp. StRB126]
MSKKKLLIHEVFRKAREDFPAESTKSGWASELSDHFEKNMNFMINEKTFTRYYDTCIRDNKDVNIKDVLILNKLSQYVGYKDFFDFSSMFIKKDEEVNKTTVRIKVDDHEESLSDKISNIFINITNEQHFKVPEFVKQNGLGFAGVFLVISVLIGSHYSSRSKKNTPLSFFGGVSDERSCMFWDDSEYKLSDCNDKNPQRSLIPKDTIQLKYFKRITRKDTLTLENAVGTTWYSKFNGNVEFFTMDGVDPDTGRELRVSTAYIIEKYAGY